MVAHTNLSERDAAERAGISKHQQGANGAAERLPKEALADASSASLMGYDGTFWNADCTSRAILRLCVCTPGVY